MNKKKAYIVILFMAGLLVGELHQFFNHYGKEVDRFVDPPKYLPTFKWWLKDIGSMSQRLLWVYAAYLMSKMIDSRLGSVLCIFVVYCVLDMLLYFVCYQLYGYSVVYGIIGLFTFIILRKR